VATIKKESLGSKDSIKISDLDFHTLDK